MEERFVLVAEWAVNFNCVVLGWAFMLVSSVSRPLIHEKMLPSTQWYREKIIPPWSRSQWAPWIMLINQVMISIKRHCWGFFATLSSTNEFMGQKADISSTDISKTKQLAQKLSRYINSTAFIHTCISDLGGSCCFILSRHLYLIIFNKNDLFLTKTTTLMFLAKQSSLISRCFVSMLMQWFGTHKQALTSGHI